MIEERAPSIQFNRKTVTVTLIISFLFLNPNDTAAQEIENYPTLKRTEAIELAKENFPLLQNKKLEIGQQRVLKKTAWDLGTTRIFTSGEEIDEDRGIYTPLGIAQQGIDIFGIAPKLRVQRREIALAEKALELSELELAREVNKAWTDAFVARRKHQLFSELDSIYKEFERAIKLRYEVEAISRLQMITAKNEGSQVNLQKKQAYTDYLTALERLNLWLGEDSYFRVPDELQPDFNSEELLFPEKLRQHPRLDIFRQQVRIAEAEHQVAKAEFLPKINLQYGFQEVHGNSGFYSYQGGITIPILSGETYARTKVARIETEIAENTAAFEEQQLQVEFAEAQRNYEKWKAALEFYQEEALPLSVEQRKGALLAFNEGAIDYVEFIRILDDVVRIELNALDALQEYLEALTKLEYFLND